MVRIFGGEDFDGFEYDLYTRMTIQSGVIPLKNGPNGKQAETDQNSGDGGGGYIRVQGWGEIGWLYRTEGSTEALVVVGQIPANSGVFDMLRDHEVLVRGSYDPRTFIS